MDLRSRLKTETEEVHRRLEARLPLLSDSLSTTTYVSLLTRFFGLYLPLERAIALHPAAALPQLDFPRRRKADLIRKDLAFFGFIGDDIAGLPLAAGLPHVERVEDVFGCLYVTEGATLGGALIGRHLQERFGFTAESGAAFFHAYGERRGAMWKAWREALAALPPETDGDRLVAAARATFVAFEQHLCGGFMSSFPSVE